MSNEGKYPSTQSITTPNVEDKLQAILAEYNALRSEIQNRSNSQSHILEIHLTILALIIGFITTRPEYLKFLILVIPIESSIFGLWYLFHKSSIEEIGGHIRNEIEPKVNELVCGKCVLWEKNVSRKITKSTKSDFKKFERTTFAYPSYIVLLLIPIFMILSIIRHLNNQEIIKILYDLLKPYIYNEKTIHILIFEERISFLIAFCGLLIGCWISYKYRKLNRELEKQQK